MEVRKVWAGALVLGSALAACSGSGNDKGTRLEVRSSNGDALEATLDSRGGALELEERARVTFPPDALRESTDLRVSIGDPAMLAELPRNLRAVEDPIVVEPHDLRLARDATLELAVRDDGVANGDLRLLRLDDENDTEWQTMFAARVVERDETARSLREVEFERQGDDTLTGERRMELEVDRFSIFVVVEAPGTTSGPPAPNRLCEALVAGDVCRRAQGPCDIAETCDGESVACPPDDIAEAGVECRPSTGPCDPAESCDGANLDCPADEVAVQGTSCDDGLFCNGSDACNASGRCVSSGDPCLATADDGDADCQESCDEASGTCVANNPDGVACQLQACAVSECRSGTCTTVTPCPVFVDQAGTDGNGCGTGWGATACATVQGGSDEALRTANPRVFVRDQTFTNGTAAATTPVLTMAPNTAYYGGFAGTEADLDERPLPVNHTLLQPGSNGSEHLVVGASDARLDGFEVALGTGGFNGSANVGGGMWNQGTVSSPLDGLTVANCIFRDNNVTTPPAAGGGMYNELATNLTLDNVQFSNNSVSAFGGPLYGGAMASVSSSVTLNSVSFLDNTVRMNAAAPAVDVRGGALYDENSDSLLNGVRFERNAADNGSASAFGGGYALLGAFSTSLTGVRFNENTADNAVAGSAAGGGLHADGAGYSLSLQGADFTGNMVDGPFIVQGAGATFQGTGSELVSVSGASFGGNSATSAFGGGVGYGGGLSSYLVDVDIDDSAFAGNTVTANPARGGGLSSRGTSGSLTLTDAQFVDNRGVGDSGGSGGSAQGGGLYSEVPVTATSVDFLSNAAAGNSFGAGLGGGMYYQGRSAANLSLTNVSFSENSASGSPATAAGAYVSATAGTFSMTSVSFVDNELFRGTGFAPAMYLGAGTGSLDNAVVAGAGSVSLVGIGSASVAIGTYCGVANPGGATDFTDIDFARAYTSEVELAASGHPFLTSDSVCRGGDNGAADAAFGSGAWSTLTSQLDSTPLGATVDPGRLYETTGPFIVSFTAPDPTTLQWQTTLVSGACTLEGGATSVTVAADGTLTHAEGSDVTFTLACRVGGQVVRAQTQSPAL